MNQGPTSALVQAPANQADVAFRLGKRLRVTAAVTITNGGLASIGALVSSILLSTAVLVWVARRRP